MRILITGGAGFIGSNLQDKLIEEGHEVAILDNLKTGKKENINTRSTFYQTDITDAPGVVKAFKEFKPEAVFHLAAQSDVPSSMQNPREDLEINIIGTLNVLEACKDSGTKKIIYSNTGGAYYGDIPLSHFPAKEDEPVYKPTSFYGTSKLCAEQYVKLFGNLFKIGWVSLRYSNVYGPRQEGNKEAGVVAIFTTKLLNKEQPTINGDGEYIRDYVFVGDVVDANIKALNYQESDVFNIAAGNQITTNHVFSAIEGELRTGIKPKFGDARPGDVRQMALSHQKAREKLNWEPGVDFQTGIKLTIDFYQQSKEHH